MKTKQFQLTNNQAKKVQYFFLGGYEDYLAARQLLLNNLLLQGTNLALTSVEKYFKGIKSILREEVPKHHDITVSKFKNSLKNKFRLLHDDINFDFIKLISKSYKLRYYDDIDEGFKITLFKWKTLVELDSTINIIENSFKISNSKSNYKYLNDFKLKNKLLIKENFLSKGCKRQDYFNREEVILQIEKRSDNIIQIQYLTNDIKDDGIFNFKN